MKKAFQTQYNELYEMIRAYIPNGKIALIEKAFRFGLEALSERSAQKLFAKLGEFLRASKTHSFY